MYHSQETTYLLFMLISAVTVNKAAVSAVPDLRSVLSVLGVAFKWVFPQMFSHVSAHQS